MIMVSITILMTTLKLIEIFVCFFSESIPNLNVSYKPQTIHPKFDGTVKDLLLARIRDAYVHQQFINDVMKPLNIQSLIDQNV